VWGDGVPMRFRKLRFSHLGSYGLELARGCRQDRISRCEFFDLGAGGLKLGETAIRENEPGTNSRQ